MEKGGSLDEMQLSIILGGAEEITNDSLTRFCDTLCNLFCESIVQAHIILPPQCELCREEIIMPNATVAEKMEETEKIDLDFERSASSSANDLVMVML